MKPINLEGIKELTIGEILDMESQVPNLPEGFKVTYKQLEPPTAEEIVEELK